MALSMTGYGRAQELLHEREITAEIRSVNSRYFEYTARLPRSYSFLDDMVKKKVAGFISRGKVELYLSVQSMEEGEVQIAANLPVARGYLAALEEMSAECGIKNDVSAKTLARFSDVFTLRRSELDEETLKADVLQVVEQALIKYNQMRTAEGEKLQADVIVRLQLLDEMLCKVEAGSDGRVERYTSRLYDRLQELLQDRAVDDARVLTEAAIFADKTAVDEETVRLHSHIKQFREIVVGKSALGRKLDFLTQEVNREVNTIGSKCQELEITRLVVDMKSEVEKIREQIQNME